MLRTVRADAAIGLGSLHFTGGTATPGAAGAPLLWRAVLAFRQAAALTPHVHGIGVNLCQVTLEYDRRHRSQAGTAVQAPSKGERRAWLEAAAHAYDTAIAAQASLANAPLRRAVEAALRTAQ